MVTTTVPAHVPAPSAVTGSYRWQVIGSSHHPLAARLAETGSGSPATAVLLGEEFHEPDNALLLDGLTTARRRGGPLVLVHLGAGGDSLIAVAAREEPGLTTQVVELAADPSRLALDRAASVAGSGTDVYIDPCGGLHRLVWEPLRLPGWRPWRSNGAAVVTGGASGLGLRAAVLLAHAHGLRPVVLDTRSPGAALRRLPVPVTALRVDVTDIDATAASLSTVDGPVRTVIHCAGTLVHGPVRDTSEQQLAEAQAAKVTGLRSVLAAVDHAELHHVVTFGSVTARDPHLGMGAYGLANELLRRTTMRIAAGLPDCTVVAAEWSLWSGAGLAHDMGAVAQARRMGMRPIPLREGMQVLLRLLRLPPGRANAVRIE